METNEERMQRLKREKLFEQGVQKALIAIFLLVLGFVVHLLILGLTSKNKTVRLVTQIMLVGCIVGGVIFFFGDDIAAHFKDTDCRYCGTAGFSAWSLAKEPCPRHPKGENAGNHEAYPGGRQDAYYCALCGEKYDSLKTLLGTYCPRSSQNRGNAHVPYIGSKGDKWFKCRYCRRGFTNIKEMVNEHCPNRPYGLHGYHQGLCEPNELADSTANTPVSNISGPSSSAGERNTAQPSGDTTGTTNARSSLETRKAETSQFRTPPVQESKVAMRPAPRPMPVSPPEAPPVRPQAQKTPRPLQENPHFAEAKAHDWNRIFREEWPQTFLGVQKALFAFGGFVLAQPPIAGAEFDGDFQRNVPLKKAYRYFKQADLRFFHGALIEFTLHVHFSSNYSKASVEREFQSLTEDVSSKLKGLAQSDPRFYLEEYPGMSWRMPGQWTLGWRHSSVHDAGIRSGMAYVKVRLDETSNGHDLKLSVETGNVMPFINEVLHREAHEAGDELPPL